MNLIVAFAYLFFIVSHNVNTQEISEDIATTVLSSASDFPSSPPTIVNTAREPTTINNQRSFESLLAQKILEHSSKNDWTGKIHLTVAKPSSTPDEINTSKNKATPVIDKQFVDQFTKIFNRQYRKEVRSNNQQKLPPYSKSTENQLYEEQIRTNNVKPTATYYNYPLFNQQKSRETQQYNYPTVNEQQLLKTRGNYYYQQSDLPKSQQFYNYYPIVDQSSKPTQLYYNYPTAAEQASQPLYYYVYPTVDQVNRAPRQLYNNYAKIYQPLKSQQFYNYYPEQTTLQQLYYFPQQQSAQQMYYYYPQATQKQLYYYYPQTNSQQLYSQLNQQSNAPNYLTSSQMYYYTMPETQQLTNNRDQMSMSNPFQNTNKDQLVYYPTKNVDFGNSDTNNLYDESTMKEQTNNFEDQQELQQLDQQTYINMQKLYQQQPQTSASNQLYYYYLI